MTKKTRKPSRTRPTTISFSKASGVQIMDGIMDGIQSPAEDGGDKEQPPERSASDTEVSMPQSKRTTRDVDNDLAQLSLDDASFRSPRISRHDSVISMADLVALPEHTSETTAHALALAQESQR